MFTKFNGASALKTLIKLSAVALTSPATVTVASRLYPDHALTRIIVSTAALILVEGCLLLGWQMLDTQGKHATLPQRWLYGGLTWVAYFSLFAIALNHNEGIAGLTFRLTLGVMLIYASVEAGLLANIKRRNQAERDIHKDWRVRRYARRLARKSAMADLDLAFRTRQLDRDNQEKLYRLQSEQDTIRQVRLIESDVPSDSPDSVEMAKSTGFLDRANQRRRLSKRQALEQTLQILSDNPASKPADTVGEIGRTRQTVYDYLSELEAM